MGFTESIFSEDVMVGPSLSALAGHCFSPSAALLRAAQTTSCRASKCLEVNEKSLLSTVYSLRTGK